MLDNLTTVANSIGDLILIIPIFISFLLTGICSCYVGFVGWRHRKEIIYAMHDLSTIKNFLFFYIFVSGINSLLFSIIFLWDLYLAFSISSIIMAVSSIVFATSFSTVISRYKEIVIYSKLLKIREEMNG